MNHEQLIQAISQDNAVELKLARQHPVLVALSGGPDSVALLHVLMALGCDCRAAHCNFHLRGEESDRDERFVRNLCARLEVPLEVQDFDVMTYMRLNGGSVEMACRELRYDWFETQRQEQGCGLIAVAHHADDQVETFFLNLLRGTGVKGLIGMARLNGSIWRPLLGLRRDTLLSFLENLNQDYVTDSTNAENEYRRNRLRNLVLPVIEQQFPHAHERILDTMDNVMQDYQLMRALVTRLIPDEHHIDISQLLNQPEAATLLFHRIRHLGFNRQQCEQIVEAASQGHCGRQFTSVSHTLHVNRETIDIEENKEVLDEEFQIDLSVDVTTPVSIEVSNNNPPFSPLMCDGRYKVAFNRQLMECQRLVLRHWRRGDRIKPFGMNGSKLLSDLFVDLKLESTLKRDVWILEADGNIVWVLGYRSAALYPVKRESQDYIMLHLSKIR